MTVKRDIRALFLDIDGTLLSESNRISERVIESLQFVHSKDCAIVLCTGRGRFTAMSIADQLAGMCDYLVFHNGASAMYLPDRHSLYRILMEPETGILLVNLMVEAGLEPFVYADGIEDGVEAARVLYLPHLPVGPWAEPPRYRSDPHLQSKIDFAPISVCSFGLASKLRPAIELLRPKLPKNVSLIQSGTNLNWGLELFAAGVSKAVGMRAVCAELGISIEQAMAIGDHINDMEMVAEAGVGVAMGNAVPELLAVADLITDHVNDDGVASVLYKSF